MDIKQFTQMLSKSSTNNRGKYVPWWSNWENDDFCRYNVFSPEEISEANTLIASATEEELTAPICYYKYTLFHLLVWHNFYDAVKSVIARNLNINVNLTDGGGKGITPLMLACCRTNLEMVKLLMEAGADKNCVDAAGRTCWHFLSGARIDLAWDYHCRDCSRDQLLKIADLLDDNFNAVDAEGKSAALYLVKSNDNETSSLFFDKLLSRGAKPDYRDENGNTLLLLAIKNNHNTVALRLAHDKDLINVANAAGETPLSVAEDFRKVAVCIALKENGAKGDCEYTRLSISELGNAAENTFSFREEHDNIPPAMYLVQKLIDSVDPDDDDEISVVADVLPRVLSNDENCSVLDMIEKAGISLTDKFSSRGRVFCLRDKCFAMNAGVNAIKKLISMGVDVNSAIINGKTPVHIVANEPVPYSYDDEEFTYFEDAARLFDVESATALDNNGVSAMHTAARAGHTEMLKVLAELGADVNVTQDAPAKAGNTPLHSACETCRLDSVKTLMELGADDSMKNVDGLTPAQIVIDGDRCFRGSSYERERADKNRVEIIKTLKTLDEPRNDGVTPLMRLQYEGINFITNVQPVLLEAGVDVNRKDSRGRTALMIAADEHCFKDIIKELIRAGADINAVDAKGKTALHYALGYGSQDVARFLIKKGADYNRADNNGVTPATLAAEKGYENVLELMTDIK